MTGHRHLYVTAELKSTTSGLALRLLLSRQARAPALLRVQEAVRQAHAPGGTPIEVDGTKVATETWGQVRPLKSRSTI
jgi:hypothetical protein